MYDEGGISDKWGKDELFINSGGKMGHPFGTS